MSETNASPRPNAEQKTKKTKEKQEVAASRNKKTGTSPRDLQYRAGKIWETNKRRKIAKAERQRTIDQNKRMKTPRGTARMMRRLGIALVAKAKSIS
jgi:hypothetical protein